MNDKQIISKRRFKASFLFSIILLFLFASVSVCSAEAKNTVSSKSKNVLPKKKSEDNTFVSPDFAFPKTVDENASKELSEALKTKNGLNALKAAIQIDIARALVSADSFKQSAETFDSLGNCLNAPWNNLAFLIEAKMYSQLYSSNSYKFDNRKVPVSPLPENVMEWNRQMFADKVSKLIEKALELNEKSGSASISTISPLLTDYKEVESHGFTISDFIGLDAIETLKPFADGSRQAVIPFGNAVASKNLNRPTGLINKIIEERTAVAGKSSNKYIEAFFSNIKLSCLTGYEYNEFVEKCVERFVDTPYCAGFISAYCSVLDRQEMPLNESRRKKYDILNNYKSKFPDAPGISQVESQLYNLTDINFNINFEQQVLSGQPLKVNIASQNVKQFYILVYSLPEKYLSESLTYKDLPGKGNLIASHSVEMPCNIPDVEQKTINLPSIPPGVYALALSTDGKASGIQYSYPGAQVSKTVVSDVMAFAFNDKSRAESELFVVSAINGSPLKNADVTLKSLYGRTDKDAATSKVYKTDGDGKVTIPEGDFGFYVNHNGNLFAGRTYSYGRYQSDKEITKGAIMTDLSIYRPGDKVRFSGIVWTEEDHSLSVASGRKMMLVLNDANYQEVDTIVAVTDRFGRFDESFTLPETGLLGDWSIRMLSDKKEISSKYFTVAEYKTPIFFVETETSSSTFSPGEEIQFEGKASTYTGMPLADSKVEFTVEYEPFRFFFYNYRPLSSSYSGSTETDSDGKFHISLATEGLKDTPYAHGRYVLKVTVTDGAGETQQSAPLRFSIGNAFSIDAEIPGKVEAKNDTLKFKVRLKDALGVDVPHKIYYKILNDKAEILNGVFDSTELAIASNPLPSGEYKFIFSLNSEFKAEKECENAELKTIIWRRNDSKPAAQSIIWIDNENIVIDGSSKKIPVRIGSSYENSHILVNIADTKHDVSSEWLEVSDGLTTVNLPSPNESERYFITLVGVRNLETDKKNITLIPKVQTQKLVPEIITFRDRISPGEKESWRFRFMFDSKGCDSIAAMAVMSDKALNALVPFRWYFDPASGISWTTSVYPSIFNVYESSVRASLKNSRKLTKGGLFDVPRWETYGFSIAGIGYDGAVYKRNTRMMAKSSMAVEMSVNYDSAAMAEEQPMASMAVTAGSVDDLESSIENGIPTNDSLSEISETLRPIECPLAFFMPSLVTNNNGEVTLDFEAPDFVGTWQLQLLGYTPEMNGAVLTLDAISSKKIMARMNAPRFVRTGDLLCVSANLFNNSGETEPVSGRFEFINPLNGEILAVREFEAEEVDDTKSRIINASLSVPENIEALQIRVYGSIPGFKDGEQTIIPVLPSSTPIVESTPFYLQPGEKSYVLNLPEFKGDATITLTYCDNPVWECVTALPDILKPESVSILSHAYALFGNCIADGLFRKYPELNVAVRKMAQDSTLISPLEKNQELKTVLLNNTPWVNNAARETLRMQNLVKYSDPREARDAINGIVTYLSDRQNHDGGWSWCPEMESSVFITECVFYVYGALQNLDYLPDGTLTQASRASKYIETEVLKDWKRSKNEYYSLSAMLDYMYSKTAFPNFKTVPGFDKLEQRALKDIRSDWRKFNIKDKATAAMLLFRKGYKEDAATILRSILEFASESREKGMWFDNIDSGYGGMKAIYATSRVLEAFALVDPENPAVDKLRQWLVVSKQTMDWGDNRFTADAINAILNSGIKWTGETGVPKIKVNGMPLELAKTELVTGALTVKLDPKTASGAALSVERSGEGPAWGGVVAQYMAPVNNVKSAEIPQLSIVKHIYPISIQDGASVASDMDMKTGDKVKVTLTIVCDRDIEYVAVTDPRAACLEPADQISTYTVSDGLWFYREVRDTQTNLFIPFLPKGTHVISYECFIDREGEYALGPVNAQSQYAPVITAHSAGQLLKIK